MPPTWIGAEFYRKEGSEYQVTRGSCRRILALPIAKVAV